MIHCSLCINYSFDICFAYTYVLQAGESMIGHLHQEMTRLLRKFMAKFVQMSSITSVDKLTMVKFTDPQNQHDDDLIAVGMGARTYLCDHPDIPPEAVSSFFK